MVKEHLLRQRMGWMRRQDMGVCRALGSMGKGAQGGLNHAWPLPEPLTGTGPDPKLHEVKVKSTRATTSWGCPIGLAKMQENPCHGSISFATTRMPKGDYRMRISPTKPAQWCLGDSSSDEQAFLDHKKLTDSARIRPVSCFQPPSPPSPPAEDRVPQPYLHLDGAAANGSHSLPHEVYIHLCRILFKLCQDLWPKKRRWDWRGSSGATT